MKWYSDLALDNEYLIGIRGCWPMLHSIFSIFSARRAEKFGRNEQNLGVRAEFRAEKAIFTSTASRQNKPFYEQNLSKPSYQNM